MPPYAYGYGYARYKPQNSKGNGSPDWVLELGLWLDTGFWFDSEIWNGV